MSPKPIVRYSRLLSPARGGRLPCNLGPLFCGHVGESGFTADLSAPTLALYTPLRSRLDGSERQQLMGNIAIDDECDKAALTPMPWPR